MSLWGPLPDDVTTPQKAPNKAAWFNFSIFAGDKSWVAGVELATASEPPARKPRIWGRRPRASTPATPRCNLLLNHANKANLESKQVLESQDCKSETAGAEGRKQSLERNRFAVGQKRNTGVSHGFIFRPWPFL